MATTSTADFLVVGAGIAGGGFAAHLPRGARTIILEQESQPGYHSTGRSAAIFIRNYGNAAIRALSRASAPIFEEGVEGVETRLLSPRGMMYVSAPESLGHHAELVAEADGMHEIGVAEALRLAPILRPEKVAAAAFEPDAQDIDVDALHQGFLRLAAGNGATLVRNAALLRAERRADVWHLETRAGTFEAATIVDAAGAWADHVAGLCGVAPVGLQPMRRSMAVLPFPAGWDLAAMPLVADSGEGWYAKPDAGRLYVSPAEEIPVEPHDAYVDDMVLAEGLDRFEQATTMTVERVERSWAGLRTFAPDRTPVAGYDPAAEGFFWLAGQGGYGIQTSPALSLLAATLATGMAVPADLAATAHLLSPARFR